MDALSLYRILAGRFGQGDDDGDAEHHDCSLDRLVTVVRQ